MTMIVQSDAWDIADAYREANDEDTRMAMNALRDNKTAGSLTYYTIPREWLEKCWGFLNGHSNDKPPFKIVNGALLAGQVSDDEDDFYGSSKSAHKKKPATLNSSMRHQQHFFLVGKNVWTLISSKFGYDVELSNTVQPQGSASLLVNCGHQKIEIPPTGRFQYEFDQKPAAKNEVVSDDDNETANQSPRVNGTSDSNSRIILLPAPPKQETRPAAVASSASLKRKRYGSGLGNLGNTCFMNSTLQCLAHTEPLRRYFVTGEYKRDLNRDNPLGTGGELATKFAELLLEMWGGGTPSYSTYDVVYPRSFKNTLGKHAEQFMGYDQHDSQELATYLLDALHEDTNRVTKKPYIEKPEQGADEPDDVAADKAWHLHLRREDSRVLENFMGQVKSRVQCPTEGCRRVSTTFDPFMYLSVPIPGASDRTLEVNFVPLGGPAHKIKVTMNKSGKFSTLLKKMAMQWLKYRGVELNLDDLHSVDVWNGDIYVVYALDDDIDKIRENDVTYVFQLKPKEEVEEGDNDDDDQVEDYSLEINDIKIPAGGDRFKLTTRDLTHLNYAQNWKHELDHFCKSQTRTAMLFNLKRATMQSRVQFLRELVKFLEECVNTKPKPNPAHQKLLPEWADDSDPVIDDDDDNNDEEEDTRLTLDQVSSLTFELPHRSDSDVATLIFIAKKFQSFLLNSDKNSTNTPDESGVINITFPRKVAVYSSREQNCITPICLRISRRTTVYQLREELAKRLPLRYTSLYRRKAAAPDELSKENGDISDEDPNEAMSSDVAQIHHENGDADMKCDSEASKLLMMRHILLSYERKSYARAYSSPYNSRQLGMLSKNEVFSVGQSAQLACADDYREKDRVLELVGGGGSVKLSWPSGMADEPFDTAQHSEIVEIGPPDEDAAMKNLNKHITVSHCIEKYCQMEQLEETEMWYCNKCKEHVRAWKQFHIYRSPPILIVHLKRFHYSASTHRRDKIDKLIDFPLEGLDLTEEVMHWTDDEKPVYDCYAVSNHYGGLGGGHYTAYAQSEDGVWCHFDDSRITTGIEPQEVVSGAAYVLYYRRRDVIFETTEYEPPLPAIVQDHFDRRSPDNHATLVESMDIDEEKNDAFDGTHTSGFFDHKNDTNDEGADGDGDESDYEYEEQDDLDMPAQ